jgi:hypothetical protein
MIIEIEKRARAPISPILGLIFMSTLDELLFNLRDGHGQAFCHEKFLLNSSVQPMTLGQRSNIISRF